MGVRRVRMVAVPYRRRSKRLRKEIIAEGTNVTVERKERVRIDSYFRTRAHSETKSEKTGLNVDSVCTIDSHAELESKMCIVIS